MILWITALLITAVQPGSSLGQTADAKSVIQASQNSANPGDYLTGVVYRESRSELLLDTTPCADEEHKKIVAFAKPYKKKNLPESKTCGNKKYRVVLVEKD